MKTTYKAILTVIVVIAAGILFWRGMVTAMGTDKKTVDYETMQNLMLKAKSGFLEKSDDIQRAADLLEDDVGLSVVATSDDQVLVDTDGGLVPAADALDADAAQALGSVMSAYESGANVTGVSVTQDCVLFYCGYLGDGVFGILYQKEDGATEGYDTIEMMENWKLFYRLPQE